MRKSTIVTSDEVTSYCRDCEMYARKAARYREALEAISKHQSIIARSVDGWSVTKTIAEEAISDEPKP